MGERIPGSSSRIETLNHPLTRPAAFAEATADKSATLSPTGGEGRVRGQRGNRAGLPLHLHLPQSSHPSPSIPMNLPRVAAEVTRRTLFDHRSFRLLTSAATSGGSMREVL